MGIDKKELYSRIKIAGMLSFIPFVLAGGGLAGYFLGEYLEKKFFHSYFTIPVCIGIGILASVIEAARIIRLTLKISGKP